MTLTITKVGEGTQVYTETKKIADTNAKDFFYIDISSGGINAGTPKDLGDLTGTFYYAITDQANTEIASGIISL